METVRNEEIKVPTLATYTETLTALEQQKKASNAAAQKETRSIMERLNQIERTNRCLRVRFLDWASDKFLSWSEATKDMANRIESPCIIKLPVKD